MIIENSADEIEENLHRTGSGTFCAQQTRDNDKMAGFQIGCSVP
jgi:hypothetical protein